MRRSITVGLGVIGVVALGALVLGIAFADDEESTETRPGLDDGLAQIIAEPGSPDASDGFGGGPGDLPLDDIRDGVYPTEPDGGIGSSPVMPTDPKVPNAPVSSPPIDLPGVPGSRNPSGPVTDPGVVVPSQPGPGARPVRPVAPSQPGRAPLAPGSQYAAAPIDGLDVVVSENVPLQYSILISAGLPSGCAKPAGYEVSRVGNTIRIDVYNAMPTGNVACTAIYGMYNLNVSPGGGFEAGKTYTVQVNDKTMTFTAK